MACEWLLFKGVKKMAEKEENAECLTADESVWFAMGSLLGQGTDNMPRSVSGKKILNPCQGPRNTKSSTTMIK